MIGTLTNRVLALAGIFQATGLVQQVARQGTADADAFATSIRSIFEVNPENTEAVYGGAANLALGLRLLAEELGGKAPTRNTELIKYIFTVLHIERQLSRRPEMLKKIGEGVERARIQSTHFSPTHDNVIANLAGSYRDTISTLTPRVMVSGEHGLLENPVIANKVRALLLAAIRSAVLWRQCGGGRIQLLFNRKKIIQAAEELLRKTGARH